MEFGQVMLPQPEEGQHAAAKSRQDVDGALRGTTPLTLELSAGQHAVRVGSPRLAKWRDADVHMYAGSAGRLDFDLTE